MIKILHFIHGLYTGGAETLVKEYVSSLNKNKFAVMVLCYDKYDNSPYETILENNGIKVCNIYRDNRFGKLGIIFNLIRQRIIIKKVIKDFNPDIIHSHLLINTYVKFAHPKKGTKIFHTVHSEPSAYWGNGKNKRDFNAAKWLVKHYGMQFIVLHEDMKNEVNKLFNVDNSLVLKNGINFDRFENALSKADVRKKIGIPQNAFVLGHVGRFTDVKNHEFIIKVFEKLCKEKENAFLLLIGDGSLKQKIEEELKERSLENRFLILSNRSDIPDLLNAMDCFIFPSKYEGLGISLIEAQKMKLPCVVSDKVPRFAQISNLTSWHSLNEPIENWVNSICNFHPSEITYEHLEDWNMKNVIKKLEDIYEQ